jgi:secreted protein with Ig-like and vWFA domain
MELRTTREVVDALGGIQAVADLTGRNYDAASNWPRFKTFPADTYLVMTRALTEQGKTAPASLWRMVSAEAS